MEMKPRSAPEKGAFVPPSRRRIAGTEPAPTKTSSAVPTASAKARCATENVSITHLLPAPASRPAGHSAVSRAPSLENVIRHHRTPFGERTTSHEPLSSADTKNLSGREPIFRPWSARSRRGAGSAPGGRTLPPRRDRTDVRTRQLSQQLP